MPEPPELPGFYFDSVKNRYFPIKGPIPGSSNTKNTTPKSSSSQLQESSVSGVCSKLRSKTSKLLQARELGGHRVIASDNCRRNFAEEVRKIQASQPIVWRYPKTYGTGITALEHINVDVQKLEGHSQTDVLMTGSVNGSLRLSEVGRVGRYFDRGIKRMPDCVKNHIEWKTDEHYEVPIPVFRPNDGASLLLPSRISCIRLGPKCSSQAENHGPRVEHALITTLGSDTSGGLVYTLGLDEPLDLGSGILNTWSRLEEIASIKRTLWTAEYDYNRRRAIIGTNLGGASVDLETGRTSWFLQCKSDIFAQQIINSGNVVLCGLRNGAIVTVDFRQKRERLSNRLITHRIPCTSSDKKVGSSNKEWFKLSGDIYPSHTIRMPSSISCLVSLEFDDQYFLASSLDGSMRLYDHRLLQRGAVQSYEGHVNSHTRIRFGVDPAERFVMSGGEDCKVRIWSIKSGELLLEDKFSDSALTTMCYQTWKSGFKPKGENLYKHDSSVGAWLGSHEGLHYMHWLCG